MSLQPEPPDSLALLLMGLVDDQLSPEEWLALRQELDRDEALDAYVEYVSLHALLHWRFGTPVPDEQHAPASQPHEQPSVAAIPPVPLLGFLGEAWGFVQRSPRTLLLILAALLGGYFVTVMALVPLARWAQDGRRDRQQAAHARIAEPGTDVGSLAADTRTRWARQSPQPKSGRLRAGNRYELASGHAQLTLAEGVQIWVEAPAEFEPQSSQRVLLLHGRLAARVPAAGRGFTVATPSAEVIDLGTEFGVNVAISGETEIHVLRGEVQVKPTLTAPQAGASDAASAGSAGTKLVAGQALRTAAAGQSPQPIPFDRSTFASLRRAASDIQADPAAEADAADDMPVSEIWLGRLFGAARGQSLAAVMKSDTFRAQPREGALGVAREHYGGAALSDIAPGVRFDLSSLGWQDLKAYSIENEAIDNFPISTLGQPVAEGGGKIEDGIGGHANSVLTFDLDQIRTAGGLPGRGLIFISERAGVSAHVRGNTASSIHLAAIVSGAQGVLAAFVDGQPVAVKQDDGKQEGDKQQGGVWSLVSPIGDPLRANGDFVRFRVPLSEDAKYLTLIATSAGDGHSMDGFVWAGARLEVR